ncbi:chemotaxis protein CheW [Vibrio hannami]|uniref:chemotaxis protein CheW n=1 Tax=Vibrio hannami TaxID=2717094 RepID=UPI00240F5D28|nr:chemotaxis protein CheW [Vibrio hannami]MDG3087920.1 chemotaxis protein CheW [Vibrio hannami]
MTHTKSETEPDTLIDFEQRRFLLVQICDETYGIPIKSVREVIEYARITTVPMCTDYIQGVINVRGSVVPVINAAKRLRLEKDSEYDRYSCVVIYEMQPENSDEVMTLGILVSRVSSIESVELSQISNPPSFGSNIPRKFIWHMVRVKNRLCALLDMEAFLNVKEINQAIKSSQDHFFYNYSR